MKKLLLSSSTLVLLASVAGWQSGFAADGLSRPTLKLSGETIGSMHFFKNSNPGDGFEGKGGNTHFALENSRLNVNAAGKAEVLNGVEYSWLLGFTGDTDKDKGLEEHSILLRNDWGLLKFGDSYGVDNTMAKGPFSVVGGVGGAVNGNYTNIINLPSGVLTTNDLASAPKYATKLTYITPRFEGFQIGVSYTPRTEHKGESKLKTFESQSDPKKPYDQNSWAAGINYLGHVGDVKVALSLTGIMGHSRPQVRGNNLSSAASSYLYGKRHNTSAYAIGGTLEYQGFELGAEFVNNGKSQQPKNTPTLTTKFDAGKVYSLGVAYNYGPDKFSAGYYHSKRTFHSCKAKANVVSAGWDRRLARGLGIFAEYNNFNLKTPQEAVDFQKAATAAAAAAGDSKQPKGIRSNRGHAVVTGFKVSF